MNKLKNVLTTTLFVVAVLFNQNTLTARISCGNEEFNTQEIAQSNPSGANIIGHVTDKKTNKHIPHATIKVIGTSIGVLTDATGHFVLAHIPEGDFTIVAKYVGYRSQELSIVIEKNKTIELNFELEEQAVEFNSIVVSATRNESNKKESSTIVNVVGTPTFENTSSISIAEGITYQPGVRVEYTCANCGVPQLLINGLQGEYSQILINSRAIFSSLASVYNLEQLPTSMIDRVEIIRGGGSALFGSNAVAGVVNIITKEPTYNSANFYSNINFYGNGLTDKQLSFGGSYIANEYNASIYVYGGVRNRHQYDRNGDSFSDMPRLHNDNFGLRLFQRPNDFSKIAFEYYHLDENRRGGNKMELEPFQTDITEQTAHGIDGISITYDLFSVNQLHFLSTYIAGQWIDRDSYFGTDGDTNCYGHTKDMITTTGTQYQFKSDFSILLPFEFTTGIEWIHNKLNDTIIGYNRLLKQEINIVGFYLQNEWKSKTLNLVLGGRLDKHNLISNVIISPRASIRYSLDEHIGLRGSYSRGYRAPQTYNEDLHVEAVGGEVSLISVSDGLRPEYSNSFSISADLYKSFTNDLQTNLLIEGFYTDLEDVFTLVEKGKDESDNLLLERVNASGATVKGITIEGIIGIAGIADLQLGITLQQSRYKEPEVWSEDESIEPQNKMFRSPDFYGYFTASINIYNNLKATIFGKYTGSMLVQHYAGYIEKDEEVTTPSFFDIGLKLNYGFYITNSIKSTLGLGVKNLLDQYQNDLDKGMLKDAGFIYGPLYPRTFFMELKFDIL
jgi:outer membrane receptor for ferrienterochelin and colicins